MDVTITGVGEYTDKMIAEVDEYNQYGIRSTGVSTDTEEEEALEEDGDDYGNVVEGTKY